MSEEWHVVTRKPGRYDAGGLEDKMCREINGTILRRKLDQGYAVNHVVGEHCDYNDIGDYTEWRLDVVLDPVKDLPEGLSNA